MDYNHEFVGALGREIDKAITENSKGIVDAINNLAMNTGNKTIREYKELKKRYTELENKYNKSDCLLKFIIIIYTFATFNHNHLGGLNSDKVVEIMDQTYNNIQNYQNGFMPDILFETMIDIANEVYEKLMSR